MPADTQLPPMHVRTPEDVLAAVDVLLGFTPDHSVVLLTFGLGEVFHARLDLPVTAPGRRETADLLLAPCLRQRVDRVVLALYTDDPRAARACARTITSRFVRAGIGIVDVLRSDGASWFEVPLGASRRAAAGTPYDSSTHAFTAHAVAGGRVIHPSRSALAATVARDEALVASVSGELARASPQPADRVRASVATLSGSRELDPSAAAQVLTSLQQPTVRDALLEDVDRAGAADLIEVWSALVRAAPEGVVAPAASVLAFLAWLAGDGALAWCALERAAEGEQPCSLGAVVAEALHGALPPSVWTSR